MEVLPCGNNADTTTCNKERGCQWLAKSDKAGSGDAQMNSYCGEVSCGGYTDKASCTASALLSFCSWNDDKCARTPPPQCSDRTTAATCGGAGCQWTAKTASAPATCSDPPACDTFSESKTCKAQTQPQDTSKARCYVQSEAGCAEAATEENWDNEIVVRQGWYDKTLFELFDGKLRVTSGMAVGVVVAIIVVALCVSGIMSYIAYRKREDIAKNMRRVSEYARRTSERVRRSISGRPQEEPADDGKRAAPVNKFQKDMFAEQEKKGEEKKDVEMAAKAPDDKDKGEEEHQFGEGQPDPAVQADIDGKQEVAGNIYADADDENIRGTVAAGSAPAKPE